MTVLRRLCAAVVVVLLGGIATPGTSWAGHRDRAPRITVTNIEAAEGQTVSFQLNAQIDSRGAVVLTVDNPGRSTALWENGRLTTITPPATVSGVIADVVDLSYHGQVAVGWTNVRPCVEPSSTWPICAEPFLWDDGETTLLPTNGMAGVALRVSNDGSFVVGTLRRWVPEQGFIHELVGWVDGELVRAPEDSGFAGTSLEDLADVVALNNRGQALIHIQVDGTQHAAVWEIGGDVTDIGTAGFNDYARDINDRGEVIGQRYNDETSGGFLWRNGRTIDLGPVSPTDLNNRGQIIGLCVDPRVSGCLWDHGRLTQLSNEDTTIAPVAINDRRQVIGYANAGDVWGGDGPRALLWQKGRLIDLSAASGFDGPSEALGINNRGQIIGTLGPNPHERPVLWTVRH